MKKYLKAAFIIFLLILAALFIRNFVYTPQYYKAAARSEGTEVYVALGKLESSPVRFMLENNNDCFTAALSSLDIAVPAAPLFAP
jgi:hypothetical protein